MINNEERVTLESKYKKLSDKRKPYLDRARIAASLTLPSLIPPDDNNGNTEYEAPYQSLGADGINNLSAKLTLVMLPPNTSPAKFEFDTLELKRQAKEAQDGSENTIIDQTNSALAKIETELTSVIEAHGDRVALGEMLKHILVAGSVASVDIPDVGLKIYPLSRFVVTRDYSGNPTELITTETIAYSVLPDEVKNSIPEEELVSDEDKAKQLEEKEYQVYTSFKRDGDSKLWIIEQEIAKTVVTASAGTYPINEPPFTVPRYTRIDGEDYGRGFIEEYIGDLNTLEGLTKALKEAALAAAKFIVFVKPGGVTRPNKVQEASNGDIILGDKNDVGILQSDKYYDLKTAEAVILKLEKRLGRVFLLFSAVTRDSERVTAEEIRYTVKELQEALGNFYSILNREFLLPYIKIKFHHYKKKVGNNLPDLLKKPDFRLKIVAGLDALGRGSEIEKLNVWVNQLLTALPLVEVGLDINNYVQRVSTALQVNSEGLWKTPEQQQQEQQALQQQKTMEQVTPKTMDMINNTVSNEQKAQLQTQEEM